MTNQGQLNFIAKTILSGGTATAFKNANVPAYRKEVLSLVTLLDISCEEVGNTISMSN